MLPFLIATAMTGIAALLLPGGTTAHSRFGIPVPFTEDAATSNIAMQSARAQVLREATLIVVDEATMGQRAMFELMDTLLRDIMRTVDPELANVPFGGKVVVLSGDFRQLAPIVQKASRGEIVSKTLQKSELWADFKVLKLTMNMRVALLADDPPAAERLRTFASWLLRVGDGHDVVVRPPEHMRVDIDQPMDMIQRIFPGLESDTAVAMDSCILSTHNRYVDELNHQVLDLLNGPSFTYLSADAFSADAAELELTYPVEVLNSLTPPGLPPHELVLKEGAPVVFIRNISQRNGVMNGTRAIVVKCKRHLLQVRLDREV